jgi:hypothetical protein
MFEAPLFPADPNAPGGPGRSEYLERSERSRRPASVRRIAPAFRASGWPPVRQLRSVGSASADEAVCRAA